MKSFKRGVSLIFAVAVFMTMLSFTAAAGDIQWPAKKTFYLQTYYIRQDIDITDLALDLKHKQVKSSRPGVAAIKGVYQYESSDYYEGTHYAGSRMDGRISLEILSPGTTTISFKQGTKTYKTKVTVKDYVNPLKKFTIPGIENGKNVASVFKKKSRSTKLSAPKNNKKTGNVYVQAADGWKITALTVNDGYTDDEWTFRSSGVKSCKVRLRTPIKPWNYWIIEISAVNVADQGIINLVCYIGDGN